MSFERHCVSNQRQFDCLFNDLVGLTSKTTSNFSITSPLWVESFRRHVKSPTTRLFVQQFIQDHNKGQVKALHFWFIVRRIRWPMDSPRKEPAIREAFSCHKIMDTNNNTSTTIVSIILDCILHTYALKYFGTDFVNKNGKVTHWTEKSRIFFLNKSRIGTDMRHDVAHATPLQWYIYNVWIRALP